MQVAEMRPGDLHRYDVIILSNAGLASRELLATIARTRRHVLFEHDLRICRWRGDFPVSPEPLHHLAHRCLCPQHRWREVYASAAGVIYLTALQRGAFHANPWFRPPREAILGSSLFSAETFERIAGLRRSAQRRGGACVAFSRCRIKGYAEALAHCRRAGWPVREIRDRSYHEALGVLAERERFVYVPRGLEPAGRMPVEARLLGCEVVVNDHVGAAREPFWSGGDEEALAHLREGPARFWRLVDELVDGTAPPLCQAAVSLLPARPSRLAAVRHTSAAWRLM